jgi:glycosyltransferase involved in cell wall biosynthesis
MRNSSIKQIHTFRVDVDPEAGFDTKNRRKLANMADTVTAVSKHTAETAEEVFGVEPTVIYNGVDSQIFNPSYQEPDLFQQFPDDNPVFLYVGSFSQRKRPGDVVEVAKAIPEATFLMIGKGELYSEVKESAKSIDNIHLTGYVEKKRLPPIYANSSGFIFPTVLEGCPNVVLEAMASETPVIGYEATSMPELVTNDETGYLTSVGDIQELVSAANMILEDDTNVIGKKAREYILNNHTFELIGENYEDEYNKLMK